MADDQHQQQDLNSISDDDLDTFAPPVFSSSPCTPIVLSFVDICYKVKLDPRVSGGGSGGIKKVIKCVANGEAPPEVKEPALADEKIILEGVTGVAKPGELLALLGPSGSGKSTLLGLLSGRLSASYGGAVLTNGRRLTTSAQRRSIGYVPQDDVLYPHLTVRETLTYCALLRLPRSLPRADKLAAVESAISELGLSRCADTPVGSAFVRGVSGGERRRVSVAHELLLGQAVVLLDEPTSGLDATAAHRMVATLKSLAARQGRTVVAAVHQPSSRVFRMFDSVLLLADGRQMFFGRGAEAMDYFSTVGYAPRYHVNPADFMLDLANGVAEVSFQGDIDNVNVKQTLFTSYNRVMAPKVKAAIDAGLPRDAIRNGNRRSSLEGDKKNYASISWFSQFSILLQRSLKERSHETFNSLRVIQVIAAAVLGGAMWWHSSIHHVRDRLGFLFFVTIFWGVFPSFNAVFTFPQERAILIKERSSGMYSLSAYFMSRMVGDLPMELILPTIFIFVSYWMAGLSHEVATFALTLIVLLGYVLVAQGLGLALGGLIMDAKQASTLVTVIMLAFLLTGGFYVSHVPAIVAWSKYTSFTYYCYRLLVKIQYRGVDFAAFPHYKNEEGDVRGGVSEPLCTWVLFGMFVVFRVLAYVALRRRKI